MYVVSCHQLTDHTVLPYHCCDPNTPGPDVHQVFRVADGWITIKVIPQVTRRRNTYGSDLFLMHGRTAINVIPKVIRRRNTYGSGMFLIHGWTAITKIEGSVSLVLC